MALLLHLSKSRARCELLISIHGGPFISRKAARLTYATQSEDRLARLQTARLKVEGRAFGRGELSNPGRHEAPPAKPLDRSKGRC